MHDVAFLFGYPNRNAISLPTFIDGGLNVFKELRIYSLLGICDIRLAIDFILYCVTRSHTYFVVVSIDSGCEMLICLSVGI